MQTYALELAAKLGATGTPDSDLLHNDIGMSDETGSVSGINGLL